MIFQNWWEEGSSIWIVFKKLQFLENFEHTLWDLSSTTSDQTGQFKTKGYF